MESVDSVGDEYVAFTFSLCQGSLNQISVK